MSYSIFIEPDAINDIQEAIDYYEEIQPGLGVKFENILNEHITTFELNPHFQIRYDNVHCLPLKTFPFMVNYSKLDSKKEIIVRAVFHTSIDPERWLNRK